MSTDQHSEGSTRQDPPCECEVLRGRVAELEAQVEKDLEKQRHADRLTMVLKSIRNVNQLIVTERNIEVLVRKVCEVFVEDRGFYSSWIALSGDSNQLTMAAQSGLGKASEKLQQCFDEGVLPPCLKECLQTSEIISIEDPASTCGDCPIASEYEGRSAMTIRLEHRDEVFGALAVSIPKSVHADEEEFALFKEVAGDLSYALFSIAQDKLREAAEAAAIQSAQELSQVLDTSANGVRIVSRNFEVLRVNRAFLSLAAVTQAEALEKKCYETFRGPLCHTAECPLLAVVDPEDSFSGEVEKTATDGNVVLCSMRATPFLDAQGEVMGIVEDFLDITQLRAAQETVLRQGKLAILGQLAGGIGHELRHPLGVISNAVYFLQMVLTDVDETVEEYLGILDSEVHRADRIITDLLDFSRTRPADMSLCKAGELLSNVAQKVPSPEEIKVVFDIGPNLPSLSIDVLQIEQVLINLINNAYQAMEDSGPGTLTITAQAQGEGLELSIADTGKGISRGNLEKIFEPLFTTRAKGTGLGLAIARTLVENNHGELSVQSVEGEGTSFSLRFPTPSDTSSVGLREGV